MSNPAIQQTLNALQPEFAKIISSIEAQINSLAPKLERLETTFSSELQKLLPGVEKVLSSVTPTSGSGPVTIAGLGSGSPTQLTTTDVTSALQNQVTQLTTTVSSLQSQHQSLVGQHQELLGEHQKLAVQHQALVDTVNQHDAHIQTLASASKEKGLEMFTAGDKIVNAKASMPPTPSGSPLPIGAVKTPLSVITGSLTSGSNTAPSTPAPIPATPTAASSVPTTSIPIGGS
jgi:prefoldin subunit 5